MKHLLSIQHKLIFIFFIVLLLVIQSVPVDAKTFSKTEKEECKTVWDCVGDKGKQEHSVTGNEESINQNQSPPSNGSTFTTIVKVVCALGFVLFLLYFLLKFIQKKTKTFHERGGIQTVGGVGVGSNRSVQLVKVGKTILVVGVGETVSLLKEITDEDEVEELLAKTDASPSPPSSRTISDWLVKLKGVKVEKSSRDFSRLLKSQLDDLAEERKTFLKTIGKKGKPHE
ncbi:flagellar biosynthetic protein FliO [Fictibacillus sp. Mic-4]|uniref:flagellar biosynthetic protein FliO n=1 Tax=Fictibacillus sp. Mic-4 TaxID=3132826 RepID=UPI003CF5083A